jgi:hypothetical protein
VASWPQDAIRRTIRGLVDAPHRYFRPAAASSVITFEENFVPFTVSALAAAGPDAPLEFASIERSPCCAWTGR